MMASQEVKYYSSTETAAELRKLLAEKFPNTKFSVRTKQYSGGSSIDVQWTDGAAYTEVEKLANGFSGASFDGMQDLKTHHDSTYKGQKVRWGADYIFCNRNYSKAVLETEVKVLANKYGMPPALVCEHSDGSAWIDDYGNEQAGNKYRGRAGNSASGLIHVSLKEKSLEVARANSRKGKEKSYGREYVAPPITPNAVIDGQPFEMRFNGRKNGVELHFEATPAPETVEMIELLGFKLSWRGFWYAKRGDQGIESFIKIMEQSSAAQAANSASGTAPAQPPVAIELEPDEPDEPLMLAGASISPAQVYIILPARANLELMELFSIAGFHQYSSEPKIVWSAKNNPGTVGLAHTLAAMDAADLKTYLVDERKAEQSASPIEDDKKLSFSRYEYCNPAENSDKLWEIAADLDSKTLVTRWGRRGAKMQGAVKKFANTAELHREEQRLIQEKLSKGYSFLTSYEGVAGISPKKSEGSFEVELPEPRQEQSEQQSGNQSINQVRSASTSSPVQRRVERFRQMADDMQKDIDRCLNPNRKTNTYRRAAIASSMASEGFRLTDIQNALRQVADAMEAGIINSHLAKLSSKTGVEWFVKQCKKSEENYEYLFNPHDPKYRDDHSERKFLKQLGIENPRDLAWALQAFKAIIDRPAAVNQSINRLHKIRELELSVAGRKFPGYFPTPKKVVKRLMELAQIEPGMSTLEPSAGKGDIADALFEASQEQVICVEVQSDLCKVLEAKGHYVCPFDFSSWASSCTSRFDRVVMNPPWGREVGEFADTRHVVAAYKLLKPGGKLVAIVGEGCFFRTGEQPEKFRQWLQQHNAFIEKVDNKAFLHSDMPTGAQCRIIVINK